MIAVVTENQNDGGKNRREDMDNNECRMPQCKGSEQKTKSRKEKYPLYLVEKEIKNKRWLN